MFFNKGMTLVLDSNNFLSASMMAGVTMGVDSSITITLNIDSSMTE